MTLPVLLLLSLALDPRSIRAHISVGHHSYFVVSNLMHDPPNMIVCDLKRDEETVLLKIIPGTEHSIILEE